MNYYTAQCEHGETTMLLFDVPESLKMGMFICCTECKVDFLLSTRIAHCVALDVPLPSILAIKGMPTPVFAPALKKQRAKWSVVRLAVQRIADKDLLHVICAMFVHACLADTMLWTIQDMQLMAVRLLCD